MSNDDIRTVEQIMKDGGWNSGTIIHELRHTATNQLIAFLSARPGYCDRGRWTAGFEVGFWKSDADLNPRYYFDLAAGKSEVEAYLRAKRIDITNATWIEATY